jgi:hypothetical protein
VSDAQTIATRLQEIVGAFLHETPKDVKTLKNDVKNEREEIKAR